MDYEKEIPFGVFDSELMHQEIYIPEGFEATIDGDKIILKKIESEDERIRKLLVEAVTQVLQDQYCSNRGVSKEKVVAWLEKQGTSYTKRDVDDAYVEGMAFAKNELEKQGDSPIKWNKNTEGNKPQVNHSVLMKTTYGIAEGEWDGECWLQYRWSSRMRDNDVLSWIELSDF